MRRTRHLVPTWMIHTLSAVLVGVGAAAILSYVTAPETTGRPAATPTTTPAQTQATTPRTSSTSIPPRPEPKRTESAAGEWPGFPEQSTPIVLVVDRRIDPYWQVDEAAARWNAATGCNLFRVTYDGPATPKIGGRYRVREQRGLTYRGDPVRGLFGVWNERTGEYEILFDPYPGPLFHITMHELGHAAGLDHYPGRPGVMGPGSLDQPSPFEIADARRLNPKRCAS